MSWLRPWTCAALCAAAAWGFAAPQDVSARPQASGPESAFPADWYGRWAGRCANTNPDRGQLMEFAMELWVEPTDDDARTRWAIVYGEGDQRQVRDYELVAVDASMGRFQVDEKNSIVLDASFVDGVLHQMFGMGDQTLHVRFEREGERLAVEMATFGEPQETGRGVRTHALRVVQQGTLERQEGEAEGR